MWSCHPPLIIAIAALYNSVSKARPSHSSKMGQGKKSSKATKAGLNLSIARVDKKMRDLRASKRRVGGTAATFTTAAVELILSTAIKGADKVATAHAGKQLLARHVQLAVLQNDDLNSAIGHLSVGSRECLPNPIEWILTKTQQEKRAQLMKEAAQLKEAEVA